MHKIVFLAVLGLMAGNTACPPKPPVRRIPAAQKQVGDHNINEAIRVTNLQKNDALYSGLTNFQRVENNKMLCVQLPAVLRALSQWAPEYKKTPELTRDVMVIEYAIRSKIQELPGAHKVEAAKRFLLSTTDRTKITLTSHPHYSKATRPASARKKDSAVRSPATTTSLHSSTSAGSSSRGHTASPHSAPSPRGRSESPQQFPQQFTGYSYLPYGQYVSPRSSHVSPRGASSFAPDLSGYPTHVSPLPLSTRTSPAASPSTSPRVSPRTSPRGVTLAITDSPAVSPTPRTSRFPANLPRIMHQDAPVTGSSADWFAEQLAPRQPSPRPAPQPARSPRTSRVPSPRSASRPSTPVDEDDVLLDFSDSARTPTPRKSRRSKLIDAILVTDTNRRQLKRGPNGFVPGDAFWV